MPKAFVTTSWDDDDRSNLKLAEMLNTHRISGTFYVPSGKLGTGSHLSATDLRNLAAAGFEIGAHTVSHAILPSLGHQEMVWEVTACKKVLQQALSAEVAMFCYPKGRFNLEVMKAVRGAGYRGARGTQMFSLATSVEPFAIPVTLQAYPHGRSKYLRNLLRRGAVAALLKAIPDLTRRRDWVHLGKRMFDRVLRDGGIWHLYGHSWEIEKLSLWPQLNEMLEYVSQRPEVRYITNGQILDPAVQAVSDMNLASSHTAEKLR